MALVHWPWGLVCCFAVKKAGLETLGQSAAHQLWLYFHSFANGVALLICDLGHFNGPAAVPEILGQAISPVDKARRVLLDPRTPVTQPSNTSKATWQSLAVCGACESLEKRHAVGQHFAGLVMAVIKFNTLHDSCTPKFLSRNLVGLQIYDHSISARLDTETAAAVRMLLDLTAGTPLSERGSVLVPGDCLLQGKAGLYRRMCNLHHLPV